MSLAKIAYLGLLDGDQASGDARGESHLTRLAESVSIAWRGECEIELISCGPQPRVERLREHVVRRVLPVSGSPLTPWDACSWELPAALADADIVHLHDYYSRTCELALLIAKQQRKFLCLTDYGITANWLATELELHCLADAVICHAADAARKLSSLANVEFLPAEISLEWFGIPAEWPSPCFIPSTRPRDRQAPRVDYASLGDGLQAVYSRAAARALEAAA
ncbi:MAG TPA: hypothetical protein VHB99_07240 [Pirellulales bacterium]|nr:hypothetical protein [Pirellulales bacterium]